MLGDRVPADRDPRRRDRDPRHPLGPRRASSSARPSRSWSTSSAGCSRCAPTIALTHAVEVTPEQAKVLHNVIEGLCIRTGLPEAAGLHRRRPGAQRVRVRPVAGELRASRSRPVCSTSCRGRELEGVLAHEMSHVRNRDVQVDDARGHDRRHPRRGRRDRGPHELVRRLGRRRRQRRRRARCSSRSPRSPASSRSAPASSRSRSPVTAKSSPTSSAAELVSPDGIRKALEKLEADHTVVHHVSRATAHLWLVTPLRNEGDDRHAKLNRMFDSHPPLDERIAILRKLEGLDPNERGPVDETITGVPVDLQTLAHAADRRTGPAPVLTGGLGGRTPRPHPRRRGRRRRARDDPETRRRARPVGSAATRRPCATGTATCSPTGPRRGTAPAGSSRRSSRGR